MLFHQKGISSIGCIINHKPIVSSNRHFIIAPFYQHIISSTKMIKNHADASVFGVKTVFLSDSHLNFFSPFL
jgi:hypothetical protein